MQPNFIDLETISTSNEILHKHYKMFPTVLDVTGLNLEEVRDLSNFIQYKIEKTTLNPSLFHRQFIRPLIIILHSYNGTGLKEHFEKYLPEKKYYHKVAATASLYYNEKKVDKKPCENDIIYLKNIPISKERMGSGRVLTMNTGRVINIHNRKLVKKWIMYMLLKSNLAVTTIEGKFQNVRKILNRYSTSCNLWTEDDARTCFNDILAMDITDTSKQSIITAISDFFVFLAENHLIVSATSWLLTSSAGVKVIRKYRKSAPSDYVLSQIFNALSDADDFIKLTFLILYCTGMRISELQSLKRNCLEIRNKTTFIRYYQSKMMKEVSNVIPPNLASMIQDYITHTPSKSDYLFENTSGNKLQTETFRRRLKIFFNTHNIKNEDGTTYTFRAHAFRHLMAVRMHKYKIPYRYIQEQLHHDSPIMTLFYLEYLDEERIKRIKDWITGKGKSITPEDIMAKIHSAQLESYILPNGLCTRPTILPSCSHCDVCYGCKYYTTSKEHLPVLKKQRDRIEGFIAMARQKQWDKAVTNSLNTLNQIETIIKRLEELT